MPRIHPRSLFAHAELAPFRAAAMDTPTGRRVVRQLDRLPIKFTTIAPKDDPHIAEAMATYNGRTNTLYVRPELRADAELMPEILLHEGMHRIQRGSRLHQLADAAFFGIGYAVSGWRNMIAPTGAQTMKTRFQSGVVNRATHAEAEAYLVNYNVVLEQGRGSERKMILALNEAELNLGRRLRPYDVTDIVLQYGDSYEAVARSAVRSARQSAWLLAAPTGIAAVAGGALAVDRYVHPYIPWPDGS